MAKIDRYTFQGERVLFDVTVSQLTAGSTYITPVTGSSSTNAGTGKVTELGGASSITSTALSGDYGDLTRLIVISAVDSDGSAPDAAIWPVVDGTDLGDDMILDASQEGNMMPNPAQAVGGFSRVLGIPVRQAVQKGIANWALQATGLKAKSNYRFRVQSTAGWGNSGNVITPLRIIGIGDKLDGQALNTLAETIARQGYDGHVTYNAPGFDDLDAYHSIAGGLSSATWTALPGGTTQQGVKISRFFRYAYNATATPKQGEFILSTDNGVKGAEGNVADGHDLGFNYTDSKDYLFLLEFGVRPGTNQAFVGFRVDDQILPDDNGFPATSHVNPFPYGLVQPQRPDSNLYWALRKPAWQVVASTNKVAWFVTANGTAIPANSAGVALGGVKVQRGNQ